MLISNRVNGHLDELNNRGIMHIKKYLETAHQNYHLTLKIMKIGSQNSNNNYTSRY